MPSLLKCHGSGNDFFLLDETELTWTDEERRALTLTLCDRQGRFGADGLLLVRQDDAGLHMRILNADATEAEMCGNGLRCVGRYASEITEQASVVIHTMKESIPVALSDSLSAGVETYHYRSAAFDFDPATLPMVYDGDRCVDAALADVHPTLRFTALSAPNPHIVAFVPEASTDTLREVGSRANALPERFPRGVNVTFATQLAATALYAATFERGVGLTGACGTAMTATCLSGATLGHLPTGQWLDVYTPGGMVRCRVSDDRQAVELSGNATFVFELDVDGVSAPKVLERRPFDHEVDHYDQFLAQTRSRLEALRTAK